MTFDELFTEHERFIIFVHCYEANVNHEGSVMKLAECT